VILMTAFGTLESAIEAVREGAYDYVSKPFKAQELLLVVERALESRRIAAENRQLKTVLREQSGITEIIGRSPKMIDVFKSIARAADSTAAVLIQGETGVGKELVARAVHNHGPRKHRPFLAINCAALSESLLESELFGHEKGAFTGAVARKAGLFEEADGGTVFLDEIGDMPSALQAKVLRALQSGEIRPVGANVIPSSSTSASWPRRTGPCARR
jgi:DNA-binding NtrC family response regulator